MTKNKKRVYAIIGFAVIMFIMVTIFKTYIYDNMKMSPITRAIKAEYGEYVKLRHFSLYGDKGEKELSLIYALKRNSTETISQNVEIAQGIKTIFEDYLDANQDFFLNDSYKLSLKVEQNKAEFITFSNIRWNDDEAFEGNNLTHVVTGYYCPISYISTFQDIEHLFFSGIVDELDSLSQWKDLKKLYLSIERTGDNDEEKIENTRKELGKLLPKCKISVTY
jgi:hypothetical protein